MQAQKQEEGSRGPEPPAEAEPNPLAGTELWSELASSMAEQGRQPGAIMRPNRMNPGTLPEDFDRQTATYGGITALRSKVESFYGLLDRDTESRRAVAAAAWFAEQDIRTLCETFEDPIAGVSISEDGFVVIHLSVTERLDVVCLLAVAPSGESAISTEGERSRSIKLLEDPFHRSNVGQGVKQFLGSLPSTQEL